MKSPQQALTVLVAISVFLGVPHGTSADEPQSLRVAVAQIPVTRDIDQNVAAIQRAIERAIDGKADILLTPEGSLSGYTPDFDQAHVEKELAKIVRRASAANLALALGTCYVEPDDQQCYNEIRFYDADGTFRGFHTKTLRCGTMTDPPVGEINHYGCRPLRTYQIEGLAVGGLICNDLWANPQCTPMPDPHLTQQLVEQGAQVIFHAVNGGRSGNDWSRNVYWPFHETNLRLRARVGKVWIVTADNCHPTDIPCSAPSGVVDPNGNWVAQTKNQGEDVILYTIRFR